MVKSGETDDNMRFDAQALAELAAAVREGRIASTMAAELLDSAVDTGTVSPAQALEVVLPKGVAGLFAEGVVGESELPVYEGLLVDVVVRVGLLRTIESLVEELARPPAGESEPVQPDATRTDEATPPMRWIGGRRLLVCTTSDPPLRGTWIAWVLELCPRLLMGGDVVADGDDWEEVSARVLTQALAEHRGSPFEPIGGLLTDDEGLAEVARRIVTEAIPVDTTDDQGKFENAWIDFRVAVGLQRRCPRWWLLAGTPEVQRFLRAATRLFAAAPWECPERTMVVMAVPGHHSVTYVVTEALESDSREVTFMLGEDPDIGTIDVLVAAFVDERFDEDERVAARGAMIAGGWADPVWFPHLQIHRGSRLDIDLDANDFDFACALCETLAHALSELPGAEQSVVHRMIDLQDVPGMQVRYSITTAMT